MRTNGRRKLIFTGEGKFGPHGKMIGNLFRRHDPINAPAGGVATDQRITANDNAIMSLGVFPVLESCVGRIRNDPEERQSSGPEGSKLGGGNVSYAGVEIAEDDYAELAREMVGGPSGGRAEGGDFTADALLVGLGVKVEQDKRLRGTVRAKLGRERLAHENVERIRIQDAGRERGYGRGVVEKSILLLLARGGQSTGVGTDEKTVFGSGALIDERQKSIDGVRGSR